MFGFQFVPAVDIDRAGRIVGGWQGVTAGRVIGKNVIGRYLDHFRTREGVEEILNEIDINAMRKIRLGFAAVDIGQSGAALLTIISGSICAARLST